MVGNVYDEVEKMHEELWWGNPSGRSNLEIPLKRPGLRLLGLNLDIRENSFILRASNKKMDAQCINETFETLVTFIRC
jgi:hypothetical protein